MAHTCKRCGYIATTKASLIRHLQSKTPCITENDDSPREVLIEQLQRREHKTDTVQCPSCNKVLAKSNISRHRKVCKNSMTQNMVQVPIETLENLQAQIDELRGELQKQKDSSGASTSTSIVNNTNNTNTTINNTYNIQLNNFGHENMSCLTPELLTYCLSNPKKGMSSLIETIHYNKDYPENQNLRCKSLKNNIFERFVDTQWTLCDASNTLDELIKKGYRILEAHFAETFLSDPEFFDDEHRVESMQRFRQVLNDKKSNDYHSVKRDLRLLVKDKTMYLLEMVEPLDNNDASHSLTANDE
jgi:phage FluMu protein Com